MKKLDKNMKKLVVLMGVLMICFASIGYAAWQIYASDSYEATITSTTTAPIEFITLFDNILMNTTAAAQINTNFAEVDNTNGVLDVIVGVNVEKEDFADDCTEFSSDCSHNMKYNNGAINVDVFNDDVITLDVGTTEFVSNISCVRGSCPGIISVSLNLTGI